MVSGRDAGHGYGTRTRTPFARLAAAFLAGLALLVAGTIAAPPTYAAADTLYINSAAFGKAGTCVLGADTYDPAGATNTCTFGAALTKANASATPLTVTLATDFAASIPDGTQVMIMPNATTSNWMNTTHKNYSGQAGAFYAATAAMTIDLQNKLGIQAVSTLPYTSILLSGKNITLRNASEIRNTGSAIIAAEGAANLVIEGGKTMPMDNNLTQRFLEIDAFVAGLTFRNYTVGNLNDGGVGTRAAAVLITQGSDSTRDTNLLIDNVTFTTTRDPYSTTWTCTATDSSGCVNNSIVLAAARFTGLEIRNSLFKNLVKAQTKKDPVVFSVDVMNTSAVMESLNFHNNTIINSGSCKTQNNWNDTFCSLISLPSAFPVSTDDYIQNNTFINDPALGMPAAITWYGAQTATPATWTRLHIQDNYFDGFQKSTIWLNNAGLVTMERNTFGPNTFSNANTVTEETVSVGTQGTGAGMIVNEGATSNRKIATWRPTGASPDQAGCGATITAAATTPVSPGTAPQLPLQLDVYWTASTKAELYLGSQKVTAGTTANLTVTLPPEAYDAGGALLGGIRLQTQALEATQTVSSQFSRVLPLTGSGDPTCAATGGITGLGLTSGSPKGGETMTLTGSGLSALAASGTLEVWFNGDALCDSLTVLDDATLSCVVPASTRKDSRTGPVTVTVLLDGTEIAAFPDEYVYRAAGSLRVVKRAWTNVPSGLSGDELYAALLGSESGAREIPHHGVIQPDTVITWTYTVTYVYTLGGRPGASTDLALTEVAVIDDQLGQVCQIPVLLLNAPTGCVSSEVALS